MKARIWKKRILFPIFLFLIPFIYAVDECKGTVTTDDIPCIVLLPVTNSTTCTSINISVYNVSDMIYTQPMYNYSSFLCNATFNQSAQGTYTFKYSTGDSGSIIVEGGYFMTIAILTVIVILFVLLILAVFKPDTTVISLTSLGFMAVGVFIIKEGLSFISNWITIGAGSILVGLGFYLIFKTHYEDWQASIG